MAGLAVIGAIIGIPALLALSSIFDGYALKVLWGWFVVPTFGLPQLSIPAAIGIAIVVGYLTKEGNDCKKEEKSAREKFFYACVVAVLKPSFALFFGWIVQKFM